MARKALYLAVALASAACGGQFPRDIYVDDRFTPEELADIDSAINEVNKLAKLIGEDSLVNLAGTFDDQDGVFSQRNVDNDRNELYRIGSAGECLGFVSRYQSEFGTLDNLNGFYAGTDIGILTFNVYQPGKAPFRTVVMHELGHFVGMGDLYGNGYAIMRPYGYTATSFTQADKEEFCQVHGCRVR